MERGKSAKSIKDQLEAERKRRQEAEQRAQALEEAEETYRGIFRHSNDAIFLIDHKTHLIIDANDKACSQYGYSLGELMSIPYPGLSLEPQKVQAIIGQQKTQDKKVKQLRKDGTVFPVQLRTGVFMQGSRRVCIIIDRDITHDEMVRGSLQHQKEEIESQNEELHALNDELRENKDELEKNLLKLRKSEARFRTLVASTSQIIWTADREGNFKPPQRAWAEFTGQSQADVLRGKWIDAVHPEDRDKTLKAWHKAVEAYTMLNMVHRLRRKDGKYRHMQVNAVSVLDNQGDILEWIGVHTDISIGVETRDELVRARERAEESDRLKTAFLANMSHEIRTPMNGIVGFAKLLDDLGDNPKKRKEYTKIIRERSYALLKIINEILDISKIEAGQLQLEKEAVNINKLLEDSCHFFSRKIALSLKNITVGIESKMQGRDTYIISDGTKLNQVLTNLMDNAMKYTEKGSITIGCEKKGRQIRCYVRDTGCGVPKHRQKGIFDRFVQLEEHSTRMHGGTGLGLSISKGYIEKLGGHIGLKSEPGKGTEFFFYIPFEPAPNAPIIKQTEMSSRLYDWPEKSLLIVEDDPVNMEFLHEMLSRTRLKLIQADNGFKALEIVKQEKIDLILMDIQLPGMDGNETTRQIREMNVNIPIVAQTAYAMKKDIDKCMAAGCNDYISKPMKIKDLMDKLSAYLEA